MVKALTTAMEQIVGNSDTETAKRGIVPITHLLFPLQRFLKAEASGGILLIGAALLALFLANSPWAESYRAFWQNPIQAGYAGFVLKKPLLLWVNDGLMTVFFFVVGLEIKREVLVGELNGLRQAALPIAAAIGGMVVPALFYAACNWGKASIGGWGIPMATDIAFALGVLALLGNRVPLSLKVFLTALAIVDDIGAVLVIALFYTAHISWASLGVAAVFFVLLIAVNRAGIRSPTVYGLLGIGLWVAVAQSGVHATVAGVLVAMTIPARTRIDSQQYLDRARDFLSDFERFGKCGPSILTNKRQAAILEAMESLSIQVEAPLQRMERALHPLVSYAIMPIFALANAGVDLGGNFWVAMHHPITLGVMAGLIFGKQMGVVLACWLMIRTGMAGMPSGGSWRQLYGAGWLAGIGFTMSLFVAGLAFHQPEMIDFSKVGILAGSLIAGAGGWLILAGAPPSTSQEAFSGDPECQWPFDH
jgi:NhaA family Na+:H+ antiporter